MRFIRLSPLLLQVPGVYDMCYTVSLMAELIAGTVLNLCSWAVDFIFHNVIKNIVSAIPGGKAVNFGTRAEADKTCAMYRGLLPLSGIFNVPLFVQCHVVSHLMVCTRI
jgi:hypothetical protein